MAGKLRTGRGTEGAVHDLALLDALQGFLSDQSSEPVPEGYRSVEEWAEAWGKSDSRTLAILRKAHKGGLMEKVILRRRGYPTGYFRQKCRS